jgi:hypothetical protein
MPAILRFIRFAKTTALVANIWTLIYAALVVGWQMATFFRIGSWPALPLSSVINNLGFNRGASYATASVSDANRNHLATYMDILLGTPAIVPLLLAAAFLTAFYVWLADLERRYTGR